MRHRLRVAVLAGAVALTGIPPAAAQLNTQHLKGTVGLKGGSQPPPHLYVIAPLVYTYGTDAVRNSDGGRVPIDANIRTAAWAWGINVVTTKTLFGGRYGYQLLFPVIVNNRIQGAEIDRDPGAGLSDSALVPLSLGWHFGRADVVASYTIFAPTGRYTDGATDNTGFGMWGHEVGFGSTAFFDAGKKFHAATVASFDFQSEKEDSETKVGNTMNLEGGVGADLMTGLVSAGLNYYASIKLTEDRIDGLPQPLAPAKSRVFALGPEVQVAIIRKGVLYGFVKANYQWETVARTTTQGGELTVLATFLVRPLRLSAP